jgi:hypothetical protein
LSPALFSAFAARGVERADGSPWPESGEERLLILAGLKGPVFLVTSNFDVIKTYVDRQAHGREGDKDGRERACQALSYFVPGPRLAESQRVWRSL